MSDDQLPTNNYQRAAAPSGDTPNLSGGVGVGVDENDDDICPLESPATPKKSNTAASASVLGSSAIGSGVNTPAL